MEHLDSKRLPDILIGQVIRRSHKNQGHVNTRSSVSAYVRISFTTVHTILPYFQLRL